MYFLDDSLFPENQEKLVITAAPYGPEWEPADFPEDIPLTMDQHVQQAADVGVRLPSLVRGTGPVLLVATVSTLFIAGVSLAGVLLLAADPSGVACATVEPRRPNGTPRRGGGAGWGDGRGSPVSGPGP